MRPFILDQKVRKELTSLKEFAVKNPVSMDDMLDTMNGDRSPVGDDSRHVWQSPFGFRLVLSLEEHQEFNIFHISVSVPEVGKLPNRQAISMMMVAMEFPAEAKDWYKIEIMGDGKFDSVNVWIKE